MKFIIDHDLHIHSKLSLCSNHPEQTPSAILEYAQRLGLRHICLTDHYWDDAVPGASDWYKAQNYAHIEKALPLPKADGITFDFGCETDFDKHMTLGIGKEAMEKFDFIIVPTSHLHMTGFTIEKSMKSAAERAKFYMERNHALLDMDLPFEKMGLAHFTCSLMDRGCDEKSNVILDMITDAEFSEFFTRAASKGIGIELNTPLIKSSDDAELRPYKIAKACGCKFYLGSDAHTPKDLLAALARFEAITNALDLTEDDKFPFVKNK